MTGVIDEVDPLTVVGREADTPDVATGKNARESDNATRDEPPHRDSSSAAMRLVRRIIVMIVPMMITMSASISA